MDPLLTEMVAIARRAGDAIVRVYEQDFAVQTKADESPLTEADLAAHNIIADGLAQLAPDIPVVSEESALPDFAVRRGWQRYFLVDPLDGTREFVNRTGEFTVNIALIEDHAPRLGVVLVPLDGRAYVGDVGARQARLYRADGSVSDLAGRAMDPAKPLTVVASRSHGSERLERYVGALDERFDRVERTPVGSSLKFCILAEGQADLYPRLGPTNEWDVGAAHAVLVAAGGAVWDPESAPLAYNSKPSTLNGDFVAVADAGFNWRERLPPLPAE